MKSKKPIYSSSEDEENQLPPKTSWFSFGQASPVRQQALANPYANNPYEQEQSQGNQQQQDNKSWFSNFAGRNPDPQPQTTSSTNNNTNTINNQQSSIMESMQRKFQDIGQQASDMYTQMKGYPYFCGLFVLGCLFIIIALSMLPWVIIMPSKVCTLFNLGSLLILISYVVLYGPRRYCIDRFLCAPGKQKFFALGYLIFLVLSVTMSVCFKKKTVLILLTTAIELVFLVYIVACYFPGGIKGVNMMFKTIGNGIKHMCIGCCGGRV